MKDKNYNILRRRLLEYIETHNLKPGDQLPKLRDIIKEYGFSYATVLRTLIEMENDGIISRQQGRGIYLKEAAKVQKRKQAGLIIPDHYSSQKIFLNILSGVKSVLQKADVNLLIAISNMSHEEEKHTISNLISAGVDGLIIYMEDNYYNDYSHIVELKNRKYPFVLIDRCIPELDTDYVVMNNRDVMFRICSYLKYVRGCEKAYFIPDNESTDKISSTVEKIKGFRDAVKTIYGSSDDPVLPLDDFIKCIPEYGSTRTGICLNHDGLINNVYSGLPADRKELPDNIVVFGYNNSFETPRFPTVEQFNDLAGQKAAEILLAKIEDPERETVKIRIEPKLLLPDKSGNYSFES